jgi:hypothetical protein
MFSKLFSLGYPYQNAERNSVLLLARHMPRPSHKYTDMYAGKNPNIFALTLYVTYTCFCLTVFFFDAQCRRRFLAPSLVMNGVRCHYLWPWRQQSESFIRCYRLAPARCSCWHPLWNQEPL